MRDDGLSARVCSGAALAPMRARGAAMRAAAGGGARACVPLVGSAGFDMLLLACGGDDDDGG